MENELTMVFNVIKDKLDAEVGIPCMRVDEKSMLAIANGTLILITVEAVEALEINAGRNKVAWGKVPEEKPAKKPKKEPGPDKKEPAKPTSKPKAAPKPKTPSKPKAAPKPLPPGILSKVSMAAEELTNAELAEVMAGLNLAVPQMAKKGQVIDWLVSLSEREPDFAGLFLALLKQKFPERFSS